MHVQGSGYVGDIDFGDRVVVPFSCHDNYGRPCPLVGGQAAVLISGTGADTAGTGVTLSPADEAVPGYYTVEVATAADATPGRDYYPDGDFAVVLLGGTVDGHPVKGTLVGSFSVANRS